MENSAANPYITSMHDSLFIHLSDCKLSFSERLYFNLYVLIKELHESDTVNLILLFSEVVDSNIFLLLYLSNINACFKFACFKFNDNDWYLGILIEYDEQLEKLWYKKIILCSIKKCFSVDFWKFHRQHKSAAGSCEDVQVLID